MKLRSFVLGAMLLSSSSVFASGMSCMVDTPAFDNFSSPWCFGMIWGASQTTAIFRIDNPPANRFIVWDAPSCAHNQLTCSTTIRAFQPYEGKATVIDLDAGTVTEVSATALLENGM